MGPGLHPAKTEVVRVGHSLARRLFRSNHTVFDAVALGIGDRLFGAFESQSQLLQRIAGTGVAHDRIDGARLFLIELQQPQIRLGFARLHGGLCWTIDLCGHGLERLRDFPGGALFGPSTRLPIAQNDLKRNDFQMDKSGFRPHFVGNGRAIALP